MINGQTMQLNERRGNGAALPPPAEADRKRSRELVRLIRKQLENHGGRIGFDRYMQMALYEPARGYYSAGAVEFDGGDFVTAPHVSPLFSRCLARQCRQALGGDADADVLEIGAGSGLMAQDLLLELAALDSLPRRYLITEPSPVLRARQQERFAAHIPRLLPRICWLEALPEQPICGAILANEVADALPVKRLLRNQGAWRELCVGHDGDAFRWVAAAAADLDAAHLAAITERAPADLPEPYVTELSPGLGAWAGSLAQSLARGVLLLLDYGYPRHEYYHPQRNQGALLCHYRQRAHDDPFFYPGLQDITASVDFTEIAQAALDQGLQPAGYAGQGHFLLGCGLVEMAAERRNGAAAPDPEIAGQVKRLTLPGEMGERFQAIAFTRDFSEPLIGFRCLDQQERLWRGV